MKAQSAAIEAYNAVLSSHLVAGLGTVKSEARVINDVNVAVFPPGTTENLPSH